MSTYTITTYTVTPNDDGTAYTWDVMGARRTVETVDVVNVKELKAAMVKCAVDHYDADPDNTPAVNVNQHCKGRNVAGAKHCVSVYISGAGLAARSARRAAAHASLQQSLPIGAE